MRHITMHLDFVSPYAWLAFQQLPHTLAGLHCHVEYRPVLLGALLCDQHGLINYTFKIEIVNIRIFCQ
jgi:2-hydroxychromene-2-carboxylate isomerase